jgi:hypothetical protein
LNFVRDRCGFSAIGVAHGPISISFYFFRHYVRVFMTVSVVNGPQSFAITPSTTEDMSILFLSPVYLYAYVYFV